MPLGLPVDPSRLAALCRRYHVATLDNDAEAIFTESAAPDSDVDLLVTFEEGQTPGLAFVSLCEELESLFGREVDLLTRECVESDFNPYRRKGILEKTEALYAA